MKCCRLLVVLLNLVLIQGLTFAQFGQNPEREKSETIRAQTFYPNESLEAKIFPLKYIQADDMANILSTVTYVVRFAVVESSNSLLINASPEDLEKMAALIAELDVPKKSIIQSQPIMCRVYMVERPSKNKSGKYINVSLCIPNQIPTAQIMNKLKETQYQIQVVKVEKKEDVTYCELKCQAVSYADVEHLKQSIPECKITNMTLLNDTPRTPSAPIASLPEPLRNHINRFLGEDAEVAGYWFGNLSVPGKIRAPIGPWSLEFEMEPLATDGLIGLNLSVEEGKGDEVWTIIRNSMQTKIRKPVIIGYTRDKDGSPTTGALVVIPEPMPDLQ